MMLLPGLRTGRFLLAASPLPSPSTRFLTNRPKRKRLSYTRVFVQTAVPLAIATAAYAWYSKPFREYFKERYSFIFGSKDEEVEVKSEKESTETKVNRAAYFAKLKKGIKTEIEEED